MKKYKLLLVFISILILVALSVATANKFQKVDKNIENKITKITVDNGVELTLVNGKIEQSYYVNPDRNGKKAIVENKEFDGFILVDINGNTIDNYEDVKNEMNKIKDKNKDRKYIDYFLGGARIINDYIYFISNYDSQGGCLWSMNLNSRKIERLTSDKKFPDIALFYANDEFALALTQVDNQIIKIEDNKIADTYQIDGFIINASPNGKHIAYQPFETEGFVSDTVAFYDLESASTYILELNDNKFYNHGGIWNTSGSLFAFVEEYGSIVVIDPSNEESIYIDQSTCDGKFSTEVDALSFVNDDVIEVKLDNGNVCQYKIN